MLGSGLKQVHNYYEFIIKISNGEALSLTTSGLVWPRILRPFYKNQSLGIKAMPCGTAW